MGLFNPRVLLQKILSFVYSVLCFVLPFFGFLRVKENERNLKTDEKEGIMLEIECKSNLKKDGIFVGAECESNSKKDEMFVGAECESDLKKKEEIFVEAEYKAVNDFNVGGFEGLNGVDFCEFIRFDSDFREEEAGETESCLQFKFPTFDEFITVQQRPASLFTLENFEEVGCDEKGKEIAGFGLEDEKVEERGSMEDLEEKPKTEETGCSSELVDEFDNELEQARSMINSLVDSCGDDDDDEQACSVVNSVVDSFDDNDDGFLADSDFGESDIEDERVDELSVNLSEESEQEEESELEEEFKKLQEDVNFLSEKDFDKDLGDEKDIEESSEKLMEKDEVDSDDALWEHQELIEQLKMELKKVRATGLPTILEESESPKIADDLKPWKMNDDKFHREDCIGELHKFYKSYRERMRKFDILNYQKMYAMGVLQLKDPLQSMSSRKSTAPTLKSLVSQNLWLMKHKIHGSDPMKKFIQELQGDLEVVYVGHMCLSWEFLHWQHEKALDLWDSDPRGIHQYNEVAGEFQQFQVLMQRFVEDEPFQGPRVQSYVKSRCVLRNLLQVPVIREDNLRNKRKARTKEVEEYVITSDMLVEIVEESIRIFWRFVRADKDCTTASINGHKKTTQLQNPEDAKLFSEVRKSLHKKERKLKDLLRSENCILRKFRRCREDETDQVLYFFSQVDMKLVCRVLNMSSISREQLIWCQNKLNRIRFVNRKIHVEPGFLLFPC